MVCMLALLCGLCSGKALYAQDVLTTGLEQLSALKGYIRTAEDGYRIVTDGLHLVGDIKGGELNLHRVFFSSLTEVDESVSNAPQVQKAFAEDNATHRLFNRALKTYAGSGWLQARELQYLAVVEHRVALDGQANMVALQALMRDGALSMTDGERLRHIRDQCEEIHLRYVRVAAYLTGIGELITGRIKEGANTGTLKKWYGIQ